MDLGRFDRQGIAETRSSVDLVDRNNVGENPSTLVDDSVLDSVIIVIQDEDDDDGLANSRANKIVEDEKQTGANLCEETVCRICHLSSHQAFDRTSTTDEIISSTANREEIALIRLGCGCKNDLEVAHSYCAEAWFKVKGNRTCEICGETAKNITGHVEPRIVRVRRMNRRDTNSLEGSRGCWRGQSFCNFLLACLVLAFVLPWFFRVDLF